MNLQKLSRLDLNLLVALQALLEEKSVTKAASRLFISQPAMSRVLQKLRYQLDDPLFTRTGNELIPTPKARELQHKLPSLLDNILDLVDDGKFDPGKYVGEIRIAVPEFVATSLISKLTSELAKTPGKDFEIFDTLIALFILFKNLFVPRINLERINKI